MSSHLIRQDLIPIVSGYVLFMGALALGLVLLQRQRRRPTSAAAPHAKPASPGNGGGTAAGLARREWLAPLRRPGWPRLIRHLVATSAGGYLLLMAIVLLYYYGVAKVAGSFLESAVTGCALLIGLSAPVFLAASWLTERTRRRHGNRAEPGKQPAPGNRQQRRNRAERGGRQPAGGT